MGARRFLRPQPICRPTRKGSGLPRATEHIPGPQAPEPDRPRPKRPAPAESERRPGHRIRRRSIPMRRSRTTPAHCCRTVRAISRRPRTSHPRSPSPRRPTRRRRSQSRSEPGPAPPVGTGSPRRSGDRHVRTQHSACSQGTDGPPVRPGPADPTGDHGEHGNLRKPRSSPIFAEFPDLSRFPNVVSLLRTGPDGVPCRELADAVGSVPCTSTT